MVKAQIAGRSAFIAVGTLKRMGIPGEKGTDEITIINALQINLRGHDDEDTEDKRDKNTRYPFAGKLPGATPAKGKPCRRARQEEKEGHLPYIQDTEEDVYALIFHSVLEVPGVLVEQAPAVKKDQQKHGYTPEPVDVILPVLLGLHLAFQFCNGASTV